MKKYMLFVVMWMIAIFSAGPLWAIRLNDYEKLKEDPDTKSYIQGVMSGYQWANGVLNFKKQPRIYCPPPNLRINIGNIIDIIDSQINNDKGTYNNNSSIELILLNGLQRMFPCGGE